jgi:hypothetical protein
MARVYAALGEVEAALLSFEAARAERSFRLLFLAIDPDFEPLHPDPRFQALVEDLGLAAR